MATKFSDQGIELSNGGVIEFPDSDGTIRRRNKDGNVEDVREPDDENWQQWAELFRNADCDTEVFCPESPDYKHSPDPAGLTPADGAGNNRGTDWIVDVSCKHCRRSGIPSVLTPRTSSSDRRSFSMSERIASEIWIGGKVPDRLVPDFCKAITSQIVLLDWGDARFEPTGADSLIIEACRDNGNGVRLLWLCTDKALWGEFGGLGELLAKTQDSVSRGSEPVYEYDPTTVEYRPGRKVLRQVTNCAGGPVVVASELAPVTEVLDAALKLSKGRSTVDSWSLVRTATRLLREQLPPALPSLEPFVIEPAERLAEKEEDQTDGG